MKRYKNVLFYPWKGDDYDSGIKGKKILVLGESHYCEPGKGSQKSQHSCPPGICDKIYMTRDCHEKTQDTIKELWDGEWNKSQNTQRAFEKNLIGKKLSREEEIDFWNHIAFYEYVQYSQSSTRQALEHGSRDINACAFTEVIEELNPDYVIVWGKRFYQQLLDAFKGNIEVDAHNERVFHWKLQYESRIIPVLIVDHPCCPRGKNTSRWHPTIQEFLSL